MQSRVYFINDKSADDYDRSTSFEVIEDICAASRNFFAAGQPSTHPGFRTVRIAQAPDGKLTIDDIEAWNDLVIDHVLPDIDAEIERLRGEYSSLEGPSARLYEQAVEMCHSRKNLIERLHSAFMEAYRESAGATFRH